LVTLALGALALARRRSALEPGRMT
jgi:hypothetical protein